MTMIVGIMGPGGEGGTFLDWSLHYLTGNECTKLVLVDRLKNTVHGVINSNVPSNPITITGTAHKYKKTHPTESTIYDCIDLLKQIDTNIHTMYIVPSEDSYNTFQTYLNFAKHFVSKHTDVRFIYMYYPNEPLEDLINRIHTKIPNQKESLENIKARVKINCSDRNKIITSPNVYSLNIEDMFYNLHVEIHKILSWLNLSIDDNKYESWIIIYNEWKLAQNFGGPYGPQP